MAQATSARLVSGNVRLRGSELPYQTYLPSGYTRSRPWLVLLFLHGAGERGRDGRKQTRVGIGPALRHFPERFTLLIVMPQCPTGATWRSVTEQTLLVLKETLRNYGGDTARVYLSGISMGAYGTWELGALRPDLFAALVPVCGGGDPGLAALRLANMPIWAFHGRLDNVVPVEQSREMVAALRNAGNPRLHYTEYENGGHNVWDLAYAQDTLLPWLLAQQNLARARQPESAFRPFGPSGP